METATALAWSWLNVLNYKRYTILKERCGSLDAALSAIDVDLFRRLGCKEDTAMKSMNRLEEFDADMYLHELVKRDLNFMSMEDEHYPASLKTIDDPPVFLYWRGDLSIVEQPCLAMVGTRQMSSYGKRVAEAFVPDVVRAGMVTVSGLALGIDAEVARQTIASDGKTVAVLGHGLGAIYPRENSRLADEIVESGGLLVSEFPLDARPDAYTFPARNRIIAGLSVGTVVLEAAKESGSLITAKLALDYNRDVFAVPGQVFDDHFAGCNNLIATSQAMLVQSATDVLQQIGISPGHHSCKVQTFNAASPMEAAIFNALTSMPSALDDLVLKVKLEAAVIGSTLTMLELKGAAKNVGGGKWVRS